MSDLVKLVKEKSVEKIRNLLQNKTVNPYKLNRALVAACDIGSTEIAKLLLENGADIHHRNDESLEAAAMNDFVECTKYLLDNGADPNILTENQINNIMEYSCKSIIELLLDHGLVLDELMLLATIKGNDIDKFKLVFNLISEYDITELWSKALDNRAVLIIDYLLDNIPNNYDLSKLCTVLFLNSEIDIFKKILNKLPDEKFLINILSLKTACYHSIYEVAKIILESGIDPNEPIPKESNPTNTNKRYYECWTSLECALASMKPNVELIKLLLQFEASVTDDCLIMASELNWEIFYPLYRSREWTNDQMFQALVTRAVYSSENSVCIFLFKNIASELNPDQLYDIINSLIYHKRNKLVEYIADFYGKDTLFEMVNFKRMIENSLKHFDHQIIFEYLLEFYGRERIMDLIDFNNHTETTLTYLKSLGIEKNQTESEKD